MELVITQTQRFGASLKAGLVRVFNAFIEGRQKEANRRIASMHLYRMTEKEILVLLVVTLIELLMKKQKCDN